MGPQQRSKVEKFLRQRGLQKIKGGKGSHAKWDNPDSPLDRPIIIPFKGKEVSASMVISALKNLGLEESDYLNNI